MAGYYLRLIELPYCTIESLICSRQRLSARGKREERFFGMLMEELPFDTSQRAWVRLREWQFFHWHHEESLLTLSKRAPCPHSRNNSRALAEPLPFSTLQNLCDRADDFLDLLVASEEMWSDSDARPYSVIDEDLSSEQLLSNFVAMIDIDRHGASAPLGIAGHIDSKPPLVGKLDKPRRQLCAPRANCFHPGSSENSRSLRCGIKGGNHGSAVQPPERTGRVLHLLLERERTRVRLPPGDSGGQLVPHAR